MVQATKKSNYLDGYIGQNIVAILEQRGIKPSQFARDIGLDGSQFRKLLSGQERWNSWHIDMVCSKLELHPSEILSRDVQHLRDPNFTMIPKITGFISAGDGSLDLSPEVERYYGFRTEWLNRKGQANHMKLMEVKGNSMAPTLLHGDYVLVDESQKDLREGNIMAVVVVSGEEVMVKRIGLEPGGLILLTGDGDKIGRGPYRPEDLIVIGKVVWLGREL